MPRQFRSAHTRSRQRSGIAEFRPHVFERFRQEDSLTTREGFGLVWDSRSYDERRAVAASVAVRLDRAAVAVDEVLAPAGTAVGDADLLIAETAVARDYPIATRDRCSFPKIKGLDVIRW